MLVLNKRRTFLSIIVTECLWFLLLFLIVFSTLPATDKNTYTVQEQIDTVYYQHIGNSLDNIWIHTKKQTYFLPWESNGKIKAIELQNYSDKKEILNFIVLKQPLDEFLPKQKLTVVGIYGTEGYIVDIDDYNSYQKEQRISGIIILILSFILCQFTVVYWVFLNKFIKHKKHNKQSSNNQGTVL